MKKLIFIFLFLLFGSLFLQAQTIMTPEARRLSDVELRIKSFKFSIALTEKDIARWSKVYNVDSEQIADSKATLIELQSLLAAAEAEKKELSQKEQKRNIPTTAIELQKIIVLQNERITDLLEILARRPK